jgi:hypothetical protein
LEMRTYALNDVFQICKDDLLYMYPSPDAICIYIYIIKLLLIHIDMHIYRSTCNNQYDAYNITCHHIWKNMINTMKQTRNNTEHAKYK